MHLAEGFTVFGETLSVSLLSSVTIVMKQKMYRNQ